LERYLKVGADWILWLNAITVFAFWILFAFGITRYPGFATPSVLLPFSYYLVKGNKRNVWLSAAVIFFSSKRGVLLAMFAVLFLYLARRYANRLSSLLILCFAGTVIALTLSIITVSMIDFSDVFVLSSIANKLTLLNPWSESFDIGIATAGRSNEIAGVLPKFLEDPLNLLWGLGLGWSYEHTAPAGYVLKYHYVHISPLNFLFQFGAFITTFFMLLIYNVLSKFYKTLQASKFQTIDYVIFLYFSGLFVFALTAYMWGTNPMIWILLGIMARIAYERKVQMSVNT
jgi:hypothetical protein